MIPIRFELTINELENQALGFIHLHNYEDVINIMIILIKKENYNNGKVHGGKEMYDNLKTNNKLKKGTQYVEIKRSN